MMHKVKPLFPGALVDIIAPGYACTQAEVTESELYIRGLGYTARVPQNLVSKTEPYHSQTDEVRFEHLRKALLAPDSKAIWCLRGGYGSARLLPGLREVTPPVQAKWVIGFSDITAIHLFLMKQWQWPVLHAPMLSRLSAGKIAKDSEGQIVSLISCQTKNITYPLVPLNAAAKETHTLHAASTGGNLSLVQTSIGTFWQMDAENRIVFLEECDEKAYAIDRMLVHLMQAGVLANAKAVVIGDCESVNMGSEVPNITYAIQRFANDNPQLPILRVKGIGHGETNHPLPLGVPITLSTGLEASLQCDLTQCYVT